MLRDSGIFNLCSSWWVFPIYAAKEVQGLYERYPESQRSLWYAISLLHLAFVQVGKCFPIYSLAEGECKVCMKDIRIGRYSFAICSGIFICSSWWVFPIYNSREVHRSMKDIPNRKKMALDFPSFKTIRNSWKQEKFEGVCFCSWFQRLFDHLKFTRGGFLWIQDG